PFQGSTSYTFSSFELHRVSTVLSGLILYTADFSTPETSTVGTNVVVAGTAATAATGFDESTGGLRSGPACALSAVTLMEVVVVAITGLAAAPDAFCGIDCVRLASDPPIATA